MTKVHNTQIRYQRDMDYSWNIKTNLGISMAYFKDINDINLILMGYDR